MRDEEGDNELYRAEVFKALEQGFDLHLAVTGQIQKSESETERAPRVREIEVISWKWVCVAGLVAIVAGFGIGFFSRKYF